METAYEKGIKRIYCFELYSDFHSGGIPDKIRWLISLLTFDLHFI